MTSNKKQWIDKLTNTFVFVYICYPLSKYVLHHVKLNIPIYSIKYDHDSSHFQHHTLHWSITTIISLLTDCDLRFLPSVSPSRLSFMCQTQFFSYNVGGKLGYCNHFQYKFIKLLSLHNLTWIANEEMDTSNETGKYNNVKSFFFYISIVITIWGVPNLSAN